MFRVNAPFTASWNHPQDLPHRLLERRTRGIKNGHKVRLFAGEIQIEPTQGLSEYGEALFV